MNDIGFVIKKAITFFVEPMGLIMTLLVMGLFFLFTNKQRLSKISLSLGLLFLFLFSFPPVSNFLVELLENQYPKYEHKEDITYIHVLGGGHNTDASQPISSHLSNASTKRVLEGILIHNSIKNSKIIFTGYGGDTNIPTAIMNKILAIQLGVNEEDMIVNGIPKDTKEEALFTKTLVGEEAFVLVTSASHMPRSMMLFKSLGMNPIAAPTYFKKDNTTYFLPSSGSLESSRMAIHEYIGMLWAKIKS